MMIWKTAASNRGTRSVRQSGAVAARYAVTPTGASKPCVRMTGVSGQSPLAGVAEAMLAGLAHLTFDAAAEAGSFRWRRMAQGTAMQWSGGGRGDTWEAAGSIDVTVNLHRQTAGPSDRTWCIVDCSGAPLLQDFHGLASCHRDPFIASLNLIETTDGGATWQLVAAGHISSARSYRELLDTLGRTAVRLLRMGLQECDQSRRPWQPSPPMPARRNALWRAAAVNGAARLRGLVGGDVFGIAMVAEPLERLFRDETLVVRGWVGLPPSQGFMADPFPWPGRPGVVLCETYTHRSGLGRLQALTIDAGQITSAQPLPLGLASHLSYPFVWSEDGRTFCLPEMASSRRQVLYEIIAEADPKPLCVIAEDIAMADPTIMKVDGIYFLAYSDVDIGAHDNLCLLHATRLEGPWRPHPGNPVKLDVRSSRPGGMPFRLDERLYRPAQDCSRTYGGALVLNRVKVCTPDRYQEEPAVVLRPDPGGIYRDGIHTLSYVDGILLIDGKRFSYHPMIIFHKLRRHLLKALLRRATGWRGRGANPSSGASPRALAGRTTADGVPANPGPAALARGELGLSEPV